MASNRKKVMVPHNMGKEGIDLLTARGDLDVRSYHTNMPTAEFRPLLADVAGIALSVTPFGQADMDAAPVMEVVARIGVGYDAVDVPALSARKVPLMIAGTSNSTSVAEHGLFLMMTLAKRGPMLDHVVREGRWSEGRADLPIELAGKAVLIVGFGRIGTRAARRCAALDMTVLVYDPYIKAEAIRTAGYEPVGSPGRGPPARRFCQHSLPEDAGDHGPVQCRAHRAHEARSLHREYGARRHHRRAGPAGGLASGHVGGAGLDVFETEPTPVSNALASNRNGSSPRRTWRA